MISNRNHESSVHSYVIQRGGFRCVVQMQLGEREEQSREQQMWEEEGKSPEAGVEKTNERTS